MKDHFRLSANIDRRGLALCREKDGGWSLYAVNPDGKYRLLVSGTAEWDARSREWDGPKQGDYDRAAELRGW